MHRIIQGCEIKSVSANPSHFLSSNNNTLEDFIEQTSRAPDLKSLNHVCSLIRKQYQFDFFAIFARVNRLNAEPICYFIRELDNDWTRHYEEEQYMFTDPGIRIATNHMTPFIWSSHLFANLKEQLSPKELRMSQDALDYGMNHVFNAPFVSKNGDCGLIRFINQDSKPSLVTDSQSQQTKTPELYYLTSYIYESLSRLLKAQKTHGLLSEREKDILRWIATGKNPAHIAGNFNISENTVCKHLCNIRRKFEVRNTTHAVAKAISMQIISL